MNSAPCNCSDPDCDWLHNPQDRIRLRASDWPDYHLSPEAVRAAGVEVADLEDEAAQ